MNRRDPDVVLAVSKDSSQYPELLAGLKVLRDAGMAQPD